MARSNVLRQCNTVLVPWGVLGIAAAYSLLSLRTEFHCQDIWCVSSCNPLACI